MAEHTSTPWVTKDGVGWYKGQQNQLVFQGVRHADADFIVRACNAHDDLVAALEACERWIDLVTRGFGVHERLEAGHPLFLARAALAKARAHGGRETWISSRME